MAFDGPAAQPGVQEVAQAGAVRRALPAVVPSDWSREPEQDPALAVPFEWAAVVHPARTRIAAIVHLYYEDLATEIRSYLAQIEEGVDVYISTCTDERAALICDAFKGWATGVVDVRVVPNRGRDIAPKLTAFNDVHSRYEYVLHLHGKRSPHVSVLATWRQFLLENLIGNGKSARSAIAALDSLPSLGMVAAQHFEPVRHCLGWGQNFAACQRLAQRMGFTLDAGAPLDFPSGSMFWARSSALQPIFSLNLTADDFEEEQGQTDGTLAHAIERLFFFACERAGFAWIKIGEPELYASTPRIERVDSPALLQDWFHQTRFKLLAPGEERAVRGVPEKMVGPSATFVSRIQRRALGIDFAAPVAGWKVAVGIVPLDHPSFVVERAVRSALASLHCFDPVSGAVWILGRSSLDQSLPVGQIEWVEVPDGQRQTQAAGHNRLMADAFGAGATHYIALDAAGLLHPSAVSALMDMMAANRNHCLVEALPVPTRQTKAYDAFTFDTPWVESRCVAIPRQAFQAVGGFDEDLALVCEDIDFSWRVRAIGLGLKTCPRAILACPDTALWTTAEALQIHLLGVVRLCLKWGDEHALEKALRGPIADVMPHLPQGAQAMPADWRRRADQAHLDDLLERTRLRLSERL